METIYSQFLNQSIFKDLNLAQSQFKIMLLTPLYSFGEDHSIKEIRPFEITVPPESSYRAGGKELVLETRGGDTSKLFIKGQKVSWPRLLTTTAFRYAVIYKVEPDLDEHLPIYCMDLGPHNRLDKAQDLNLTWKDFLLDVSAGVTGEVSADVAHIGETVGYCEMFRL